MSYLIRFLPMGKEPNTFDYAFKEGWWSGFQAGLIVSAGLIVLFVSLFWIY